MTILRTTFLISILFLLSATVCFAEPFKEGRDYSVLEKQTDHLVRQGPNKIKVVEFFSYACPACYSLEPKLKLWIEKLPANVEFLRMPVVFRKDWMVLARAYFVARGLGVEHRVTPLLFTAIQEEGKNPTDSKILSNIFANVGINKTTFDNAFNHSTFIDAELDKAQTLMTNYQIQRVPSFVINGQFKTDLGMAKGDVDRFLKILDYLITQSQD